MQLATQNTNALSRIHSGAAAIIARKNRQLDPHGKRKIPLTDDEMAKRRAAVEAAGRSRL